MRRPSAPGRPAFTLLELVLAATIGVFILGGLYVAVRVHLRHAQVARDVVEQATLARSLLDRVARDVRQNLGPVAPNNTSSSSSGSSSSSSGGSGSGSSMSSTSGATTPSSASSGSSSSTASTSSSTTGSSSTATTSGVQFNVGIQGDSGRLTLCTSQVPRADGTDPSAAPNGDLRRITYWRMSGSQGGLARQEFAQVTSDDAASDPPDDPALVIAGEVVGLEFSYFDGTEWQDSWDGTTLGPDNQNPIGPPVAVAINLTLATPGHKGTKTYRRVVVIQTANGTPLQNSSTTTSTGQ